MAVTVRRLKIDDKDAFLALLGQLTAVEPLESASFVNMMQRRDAMGCFTFVAVEEDTGRLVGTASAMTQQKFSRGGVLFAQIEDVVVSQGARGCGVGRLLLRHIIEAMRRIDVYKVAVGAGDEKASKFYQSCGFVRQDDYLIARL